jgi:cell division protein FtsL
MLNFKDIANKSASTLLVGAIVGLGSLIYKEYQTYQELRELIEVKKELEDRFTNDVKELKYDIKRLKKTDRYLKGYAYRDSIMTNFNNGWVKYWVNR